MITHASPETDKLAPKCTSWSDYDNPGGSCDCEGMLPHGGTTRVKEVRNVIESCNTDKYEIETRLKGGSKIYRNPSEALAGTGNHVKFNYKSVSSPDSTFGIAGIYCWNRNPNQRCKDFEVRYCCRIAEQAEPECKVDVGFVVDASGSIQQSNWPKVQKLVNKLANEISISPSEGHAGVTIFSSKNNAHPDAELKIHFDDHYTYFNPDVSVNSFKEAVESLPYWGGGTKIDEGLKIARDEMFQATNGMRSSASKYLVLITDGQQSNVDYAYWASEFQNRNIRVIVIGVGNVNINDLQQLVQIPSDLHIAENFDITLEETFLKDIDLCGGVDECHSCGPWYNIDKTPCRTDKETISDVGNFGIPSSAINCPTSYIIQGKVDNTIFYSGAQGSSITGDRVWFTYRFPPNALTGAGLTSYCRSSSDCKGCKDYSVRFCCPKNDTENNERTTTSRPTPTTTVRDSCNPNPCLNGGTCLPNPNSLTGYSCKCTPNCGGTRCQICKSVVCVKCGTSCGIRKWCDLKGSCGTTYPRNCLTLASAGIKGRDIGDADVSSFLN